MTRTGGLREWFKGNGTNCLRIVPNSAVKFVTYQELSRCAIVYYRIRYRNALRGCMSVGSNVLSTCFAAEQTMQDRLQGALFWLGLIA